MTRYTIEILSTSGNIYTHKSAIDIDYNDSHYRFHQGGKLFRYPWVNIEQLTQKQEQ